MMMQWKCLYVNLSVHLIILLGYLLWHGIDISRLSKLWQFSFSPLDCCNRNDSCLQPFLHEAIIYSATRVTFLKFKYHPVALLLTNFQWFSSALRWGLVSFFGLAHKTLLYLAKTSSCTLSSFLMELLTISWTYHTVSCLCAFANIAFSSQ